MARMEEDRSKQDSFRDRTRQEYEERRAHGRLAPAQRTCATLDEKAGIKVRLLIIRYTQLPQADDDVSVQRPVAEPRKCRFLP